MYSVYAELRDLRGLSDYAVAKGSGVGRSTLSDWKTGKHVPSIANLRKIAEFLGVTIEYLLTGEALFLEKPDTPPSKATQLYNLYLKASPEVQKAVELLLKAEQ